MLEIEKDKNRVDQLCALARMPRSKRTSKELQLAYVKPHKSFKITNMHKFPSTNMISSRYSLRAAPLYSAQLESHGSAAGKPSKQGTREKEGGSQIFISIKSISILFTPLPKRQNPADVVPKANSAKPFTRT